MASFPRAPSLKGQNSSGIPPYQHAEQEEAVDDEVEDRSTEPLQLPQVGCRDGLVSIAQESEQVHGHKGCPDLVTG